MEYTKQEMISDSVADIIDWQQTLLQAEKDLDKQVEWIDKCKRNIRNEKSRLSKLKSF